MVYLFTSYRGGGREIIQGELSNLIGQFEWLYKIMVWKILLFSQWSLKSEYREKIFMNKPETVLIEFVLAIPNANSLLATYFSSEIYFK